jgi:hypothetical protein
MTAAPRRAPARPPADTGLPALPTMLDPVAMSPVLRRSLRPGAWPERTTALLDATERAMGQ